MKNKREYKQQWDSLSPELKEEIKKQANMFATKMCLASQTSNMAKEYESYVEGVLDILDVSSKSNKTFNKYNEINVNKEGVKI